MNKPVKLLASVSVLAFASVGLYYAWLAPRKTGGTDANPPRQTQVGARVSSGGTVAPGTDVARTIPANSVPTQVPVDRAVATGPTTPPGFKPVDLPMQPLPERLQGFEPEKTATAQGVAPAPVTAPQPTAAGSAVPAANGAAAAQPKTVVTGASNPVASPASPAPASPVAVPPTAVSAASAKPTVAVPPPAPAAAPKAAKPATYTVKAGDSVVGIWRSLTGSERGWEKLVAANPGLEPTRMKIGQVLKVPEMESAATSTGRAPAAAAATTVSSGVGKPDAPASSGGTYTVESGDTLSYISNKVFGSTKHWKQIYEANKDTIGADPANLKVGQVLRMPAKGGAAKATATKPTASTTEARPAPASAPAPSTAPAPRAPAPPGTIGAPNPASSVSPVGTPAPR